MTAELILNVFVWLFWALIALQTGLAVFGFIVERREGLAISRGRLFGSLGVFAAATLFILIRLMTPGLTGPAAPPADAKLTASAEAPKINALQSQFDAKQKELEGIDKELEALQDRRTKLEESIFGVGNEIRTLRQDSGYLDGLFQWLQLHSGGANVIALGVLGALLLAGTATLLLAGPAQTLFPWLSQLGGKGEDARKQAESLDALASLIAGARYSEALDHSRKIQEKRLPPFDLLDFLFLRGFAAIQLVAFSPAERGAEENARLLKQTVEDLEFVAGEAPGRSEAIYTLAVAQGLSENYGPALELFEQAEPKLGAEKLPFEHNKSVCLLRLAESSLSVGDAAKAEEYYAGVAGLPAFRGLIAHSRIAIAMIELQTAVKREDFAGASAIAAKVETFDHIDDDQRTQIRGVRDALLARIALRQNDPQKALAISSAFLSAHLPAGLPTPDDSVADEAFSPILDADLPFPRDVFLGFCFAQAVALARLEAEGKSSLTEAQTAKLAAPLLLGLQFAPRHRHFLGALGGLYYWFRRDQRQRARAWLEAASLQGVGGLVHVILEHDRRLAMQQREALDLFRSASARILRDPAAAAEARRVLAEELGRFQEFQPLLIDLQAKPELEPEEPTIEMIRERARYIADLAANVARVTPAGRVGQLTEIEAEYASCLSKLEQTSASLVALEKRVYSALSHAISFA